MSYFDRSLLPHECIYVYISIMDYQRRLELRTNIGVKIDTELIRELRIIRSELICSGLCIVHVYSLPFPKQAGV